MNEKKFYIHLNLNKQELRQAVIENTSFRERPTPATGEDIGLMHFDTHIGQFMVWNGTKWKIVKYLDQRDLEDHEAPILLENIWTQSTSIPTTIGGTSGSSIVSIQNNIPLEYIPNSFSYKLSAPETLYDLVPSIYGSFYIPVVRSSSVGTPIIDSNLYKIEGDKITFYDGLDDVLYNETILPTITYFKYIGTKGDFSLTNSNGSVSHAVIILSQPQVPPLFQVPFILPTNSSLIGVYIGPIRIFSYIYDSNAGTIFFDENSMEFQIESDDIIRVEILIN